MNLELEKMDTKHGMLEITFHGRGGQGAVTGAELLAEVALLDGFTDSLSIPIIGAERRGAPIRAFTRLSKQEIKIYSAVTSPDQVMIFDDTLVPAPGVAYGIENCKFLINTARGVDFSKFADSAEVYTVDATGISLQLNLVVSGDPVLNVPMLGAYAKMTGNIQLESLREVVTEKWGEKAGEKNYAAAQEAYNQTVQVK
jgi:pyruvate ferredoxin oxidoreductase gamma subunit